MTREESLKILRDVHDKALFSVRNALETLIPELTESEDERIRKHIMWFLNNYCGEWDYPITKEDCLAYLEKQKEQKSIEDIVKDITKNKESATNFLKSTGIMDDNGELAEMYRSEEQKPVEIDEEYKAGTYFKGLIPCWIDAPSTLQPAHKYHGMNVIAIHEKGGGFRCCCVDEEKPVTFHLPEGTHLVEGWKQKPAEWSEEDVNAITTAIRACRYITENFENSTKEYEDAIQRLKSLRPQAKQEWSGEDEKRYISCLQRLGTGNPNQPETINSKWFKEHICPQPHWKPSEEQMEALLDAEGYLRARDQFDSAKSIVELYEQLKQLMED